MMNFKESKCFCCYCMQLVTIFRVTFFKNTFIPFVADVAEKNTANMLYTI